MSNRAHFTRTKFSDVDGNNATYGYRAADDYGSYYDDSWESPGPADGLEFLRQIKQDACEGVHDLFQSLRENTKGCYIDDSWYGYEEIKAAIAEEDDDEAE